MLPKALLVVSRRNKQIYPHFLTKQDIPLLTNCILIFKESINHKYSSLKEKMKILENEDTNVNYKIIRGIFKILERSAEFEQETKISSLQVRSYLFENGLISSKEERAKRILNAAQLFETSTAEIERAIFADLPKNLILRSFHSISPNELLMKYNLALTQTLLFDSLELKITVNDNYQLLFRAINYFGLMYETDGIEITITGPYALFKKTRRYGTKIASLLPYIFSTSNWVINATIERQYGDNSKIYNFILKDDDILLPKLNIVQKSFDSVVEKQFYNDFKLFLPHWKIKREPTFINAGNYVIIPDFGFYWQNLEIYMEVVGFWTPSYLQKKIRKLNQADHPIIVAVNRKLNCSKKDFPEEVIFYDKRIPIKPFITLLREYEEKYVQTEIETTPNIVLTKPIIEIKDKAQELNLSREALINLKPDDYVKIGNKLVSFSFLEGLKKEIGNKRSFSDIKAILDKYQLTDKALNIIGFEIEWNNGLFPERIKKVSKSPKMS